MIGIILNGILLLYGTAMIYMLTWRMLFFDANREADPMAVDAFVAQCKRGSTLKARGRLGALKQCFDEAEGNPVTLRQSLERFRRLVERFHNAIEVVATSALEVGLLGTVLSLILNAGGTDAATMIIGLGMMSTAYGLIIAIPAKMFHGLSNGRVLRFLDHVDAILEILDWRINQPTSTTLVPASNNGSSSNGRPCKRLDEAETGNGRHPEYADASSGRLNGNGIRSAAAAEPLEVIPLDEDDLDEVPIARAAAAPDFGSRVVNRGERENETTT